jgi:hypothetical protein
VFTIRDMSRNAHRRSWIALDQPVRRLRHRPVWEFALLRFVQGFYSSP